jgi:hypothetical protein
VKRTKTKVLNISKTLSVPIISRNTAFCISADDGDQLCLQNIQFFFYCLIKTLSLFETLIRFVKKGSVVCEKIKRRICVLFTYLVFGVDCSLVLQFISFFLLHFFPCCKLARNKLLLLIYYNRRIAEKY